MCLGRLGVVRARWDVGDVPMARVETDDDGDVIACGACRPEVGVGARVLVHLGFVDVLDTDVPEPGEVPRASAATTYE